MQPSGTLVFGPKRAKNGFFSVFEAELAHAESPGPYNLQAILSSDIKTDSSLKCVIFDPGGATGQIRRDLLRFSSTPS